MTTTVVDVAEADGARWDGKYAGRTAGSPRLPEVFAPYADEVIRKVADGFCTKAHRAIPDPARSDTPGAAGPTLGSVPLRTALYGTKPAHTTARSGTNTTRSAGFLSAADSNRG